MLCSAGKVEEPMMTSAELKSRAIEGRSVDNILLATGCLRNWFQRARCRRERQWPFAVPMETQYCIG